MNCTCEKAIEGKVINYDINCPTCGLNSPDRDYWCACGDPGLCCPIHETKCTDCGQEMTLAEMQQHGKCDECAVVYGGRWD